MEPTSMKYLIFILVVTIQVNSLNGEYIPLFKQLTSRLETLMEQKVAEGTEKVKQQQFGEWFDKIDRKYNEGLNGDKKTFVGKFNTQEQKLKTKMSKPVQNKFDKRSMLCHDAEDKWVVWGGHLATIKSKKENDLIWKEMKQRGFWYSDILWIGLKDEREENHWEWVNGD